MQEARDFLDESRVLCELMASLSEGELGRATGFKHWSANEVLRHLHTWNRAALLSLQGGEAFANFFRAIEPHVENRTMPAFERAQWDGLSGRRLVEAWWLGTEETANGFENADPKQRVEWAGPSMSARSSITARLMETWAHGQAIYDLFGVAREAGDRLRPIVELGVKTFGWSFAVRGAVVPETVPAVRLSAPSGDTWTYGDLAHAHREWVEGSAEAFCQVVTQTRNVADTDLRYGGAAASAWIANAQCFAGPPETPPSPGERLGPRVAT